MAIILEFNASFKEVNGKYEAGWGRYAHINLNIHVFFVINRCGPLVGITTLTNGATVRCSGQGTCSIPEYPFGQAQFANTTAEMADGAVFGENGVFEGTVTSPPMKCTCNDGYYGKFCNNTCIGPTGLRGTDACGVDPHVACIEINQETGLASCGCVGGGYFQSGESSDGFVMCSTCVSQMENTPECGGQFVTPYDVTRGTCTQTGGVIACQCGTDPVYIGDGCEIQQTVQYICGNNPDTTVVETIFLGFETIYNRTFETVNGTLLSNGKYSQIQVEVGTPIPIGTIPVFKNFTETILGLPITCVAENPLPSMYTCTTYTCSYSGTLTLQLPFPPDQYPLSFSCSGISLFDQTAPELYTLYDNDAGCFAIKAACIIQSNSFYNLFLLTFFLFTGSTGSIGSFSPSSENLCPLPFVDPVPTTGSNPDNGPSPSIFCNQPNPVQTLGK